jgi:hypothetical protein
LNANAPFARDARFVKLKLRAEKDSRLSDGAQRSLALLVSKRYLSREPADDEFPLAWSDLANLHGDLSRSTAERRIDEMVQCGYLKQEKLKGCPATWHYRFVFRCAKSDASDCGKIHASERAKDDASNCVKNGAHHTSNSLREKNNGKSGVGAAASANAAAPPQTQKRKMSPEQMKQLWESAKADAGKGKGIS